MKYPNHNHPHRIQRNEQFILQVRLKELSPGDVFLKDGTVHMICKLENDLIHDLDAPNETILIVNLTDGSTWWCDENYAVWPCIEVKLSYTSPRNNEY